MYTTGRHAATGTTFTKQLYRLLALSLAGYYDRYHNAGTCFRSTRLTRPRACALERRATSAATP